MDVRSKSPGLFKQALEHGQFRRIVRKAGGILDEGSDIGACWFATLIHVQAIDYGTRSILPRTDRIRRMLQGGQPWGFHSERFAPHDMLLDQQGSILAGSNRPRVR